MVFANYLRRRQRLLPATATHASINTQALLSFSVNHRLEKTPKHRAMDAVLPNLQEQAEVSLGAACRPPRQLQSGLRAGNGIKETFAEGRDEFQDSHEGCAASLRA